MALLASRGQTAPEIAEHLFLSKRTVESHLVTIYAKLGVDVQDRADPPGRRVRDLSRIPYLYGGIAASGLPTFIDSPG